MTTPQVLRNTYVSGLIEEEAKTLVTHISHQLFQETWCQSTIDHFSALCPVHSEVGSTSGV